MAEVLKSDGSLAELSEEALSLAGGGAQEVDGSGTDADGGGDAVTAEAGQDADAVGEVADEAADTGDGGGTEAAKWYGDDVLQLAASYDLTADDLDEIGGAEAFQAATRVLDRRLRMAASQAENERRDVPAAKDGEQATEDLELDPEFYAREGYDEATLKVVKAAAAAVAKSAALEREMAELRQWREAESKRADAERWQSFVSDFHRDVDAMGDELFGSSAEDARVLKGAADSEAAQRRVKLFETLMQYNAAFGDVPLSVKVKRAANLAFGDVIREREKRSVIEKIADQSRKRRPVASANRQTKVVGKPRDFMNPSDVGFVLDDPEFQGFWKRVESGG